MRHQLGELIDLAVGQFQNAADIAQHAAGLQRAEGDDLRHAVRAIFALDIANNLIAPVLAEIDIEIRHRHTIRIKKALEQQAKTQGVEIGNRCCIGYERSRARTTPRPNRNALRLGPADKIRNDQKIARIFHPLDDGQFEIQPLFIIINGKAFRRTMCLEPRF